MNLEKYPVVSDNDHRAYEFLSEGPNGTIKKVVFYQEIDENIFNLAFGDWDEINQKIDDGARSNNNDRDKVIATVASTIIDFMKYHPDATVVAKGSTSARTRLYQIGIFSHLQEIGQRFAILGSINGKWQPIQRRKSYQAFAASAK